MNMVLTKDSIVQNTVDYLVKDKSAGSIEIFETIDSIQSAVSIKKTILVFIESYVVCCSQQ